MQTFEVQLDPVTWTEVLVGSSNLAFDIIGAKQVEVYLDEAGSTPATSAKGNMVQSWPSSWDFEMVSSFVRTQAVYARGDTLIRGVRE